MATKVVGVRERRARPWESPAGGSRATSNGGGGVEGEHERGREPRV